MTEQAARAYLSVVSSDLTVAEISARIGLEATAGTDRGERKRPAGPIAGETRWRYELGEMQHTHELEGLLLAAVRNLGPNPAGALSALSQRGDLVELQLVQWLAVEDEGQTRGLHFPREVVTWLSAAGASIDIDQYVDDGD
jgi:hypothetical protein